MKVIALQKGFYANRVIMPGEAFDVAPKEKASWFEPVAGKQAQDVQEEKTVKGSKAASAKAKA